MKSFNELRNRPLLTIGIPTFNRSRFLRELLESLAEAAGDPRIEIIVSDNASDDDTPNVVSEFVSRGYQIRYLRNERNLGADGNILSCYQEASGKYVWLIGDDDIVPAGTMKRILGLLVSGEFDLIFLTPKEFRDQPLSECQPDRHGRGVVLLQDGKRFAEMVGNMLTMISCNIVNKQRVEALNSFRFEELVGSNLVQLGWTLTLLSHFQRGLYIFDVLVSVRADNRSGYTVSKVFGQQLKEITDRLLGAKSGLATTIQTDVVRQCLPFLILRVRHREFGDFENEDFHAALKPVYGHTFRYWIIVFPVAKFPTWLAEFWFTGVRAVRRALSLFKSSVELRPYDVHTSRSS
jgi:abequosyltransferase